MGMQEHSDKNWEVSTKPPSEVMAAAAVVAPTGHLAAEVAVADIIRITTAVNTNHDLIKTMRLTLMANHRMTTTMTMRKKRKRRRKRKRRKSMRAPMKKVRQNQRVKSVKRRRNQRKRRVKRRRKDAIRIQKTMIAKAMRKKRKRRRKRKRRKSM